MARQIALSSLLVILTAAALSAQSTAKELEMAQTTWRARMKAGASLQIKGGLGNVTVVQSAGDEIVLEIKRGNEGTVVPRVVAVEHAKGVTICADWITKAETPIPCAGPKKMFANSSLKGYASVDIRVAVPEGSTVDVQSARGDITVGPVTNSVVAKTYRGDLRVWSTGTKVRAENLEGKIEMDLVEGPLKQAISISTRGGVVRVGVPESRLVRLNLYPRGALVRSAYDLGNGGVLRDGHYEYKGPRTLDANLGPGKEKIWTSLEIFTLDDIFSQIEISKP